MNEAYLKQLSMERMRAHPSLHQMATMRQRVIKLILNRATHLRNLFTSRVARTNSIASRDSYPGRLEVHFADAAMAIGVTPHARRDRAPTL